MPLVETPYRHIMLDEKDVPIIEGTTMKVIELVESYLAYGWSPGEIHHQYPYLTMSQIHSALAFYWDNKADIDREIEKGIKLADQMRREQGPPPFMERLQAQGLIA